MNRTVFLIDGFNVYHSAVQAQHDAGGVTTKWLDLKSLCSSFLPLAGQLSAEKATLERIYYFSAPPIHRSKTKQQRHSLYMKCLRGTGVNVELGRFKNKNSWCPNCRQPYVSHEEKESDVALASKLFEVCLTDEADTIILMTGDTDLAPAARTCRRLFPSKIIFFAFPYRRSNTELKGIAPESFSIKQRSYLRHQFPDPLILEDGSTVSKPATW